MDDFDRSDFIIVRNGTTGRLVQHSFTTCSAEGVNDGWIPYGETIASVSISVYDSEGTEVSGNIVSEGPVVVNNVVSYRLQYHSSLIAGYHSVSILVTFDSGNTDVAIFNNRIYVDV